MAIPQWRAKRIMTVLGWLPPSTSSDTKVGDVLKNVFSQCSGPTLISTVS